MSQTTSVWLVLLLALLAANLPFLSNRVFAIYKLAFPKPLPLRLLEMVIGYFVVGTVALLLEQHASQIAAQGWQFYAITAALFITFAFPGFVYRYLFHLR